MLVFSGIEEIKMNYYDYFQNIYSENDKQKVKGKR